MARFRRNKPRQRKNQLPVRRPRDLPVRPDADRWALPDAVLGYTCERPNRGSGRDDRVGRHRSTRPTDVRKATMPSAWSPSVITGYISRQSRT